MVGVIEEIKALPIVRKYFDVLSVTGYVKHSTVRRFLIYIFLIDLVKWTFPYFSEKDYEQLNLALIKIFTGGGCLLPYQALSANRMQIKLDARGLPYYQGTPRYRVTEESELRSTETNNVRTV